MKMDNVLVNTFIGLVILGGVVSAIFYVERFIFIFIKKFFLN